MPQQFRNGWNQVSEKLDRVEKLKQQKAKIDRRLALALAAEKKHYKREEDRIKVLVGAMVLDHIKRSGQGAEQLLGRMGQFLERPNEREAVMGSEGKGSDAWHRLTGKAQ